MVPSLARGVVQDRPAHGQECSETDVPSSLPARRTNIETGQIVAIKQIGTSASIRVWSLSIRPSDLGDRLSLQTSRTRTTTFPRSKRRLPTWPTVTPTSASLSLSPLLCAIARLMARRPFKSASRGTTGRSSEGTSSGSSWSISPEGLATTLYVLSLTPYLTPSPARLTHMRPVSLRRAAT